MSKAMDIRDLLKKLNRSFGLLITRDLAKFGITVPQGLVLKQISDGRKTIGQISKSIGLSYSTVSGIIDRLERDEWVIRIRDDADRRVIWIEKTNKVEEVKKQIPVFQENYYAELLQDLSEQELDQIVHSLVVLTRQLEKKEEEKS